MMKNLAERNFALGEAKIGLGDSFRQTKNFDKRKEGKHYFLLKGQEMRSFLQSGENISKVPRLYLLRRGN